MCAGWGLDLPNNMIPLKPGTGLGSEGSKPVFIHESIHYPILFYTILFKVIHTHLHPYILYPYSIYLYFISHNSLISQSLLNIHIPFNLLGIPILLGIPPLLVFPPCWHWHACEKSSSPQGLLGGLFLQGVNLHFVHLALHHPHNSLPPVPLRAALKQLTSLQKLLLLQLLLRHQMALQQLVQ